MRTVEHTTTTTSKDTGEITQVTKTVDIKTGSREEFLMLFIKSVGFIFDIKSQVDIKVLVKLCQLAKYNTGQVALPTAKRIQVCEELGMKNSHLSNSIANLKKLGVLTGQQGEFEINPLFAWKGDLRTRDSYLKKMQMDFKIQYQSTKFD